MIKSVLKKEKLKRSEAKIYVIGNIASDVETAHNIKGFGILVPFIYKTGQIEKVKKLKSKNKYIAKKND